MERNIVVYNNTTSTVLVETPNGVQKRLTRANSSIKMNMEELEYLYAISPATFEEGIIIIKDEDVRKSLGINKFYHDNSIVMQDKISEILTKDVETVKKVLKKASKTAKDEIAKEGSKKSDKLTGEVKKVIEEETGKILDIDEK